MLRPFPGIGSQNRIKKRCFDYAQHDRARGTTRESKTALKGDASTLLSMTFLCKPKGSVVASNAPRVVQEFGIQVQTRAQRSRAERDGFEYAKKHTHNSSEVGVFCEMV